MRRGLSLIELVFAIVIIAIASMAVPTMISQITRSNDFAIRQEMIYYSKAALNEISALPFDYQKFNIEKTDSGSSKSTIRPILATDKNDLSAKDNKGTRKQPLDDQGNIVKATFKDDSGSFIAGENDVDDYNNKSSINTSDEYSTGFGGSLLETNTTVRVAFVDDTLIQGNYLDSKSISINFDPSTAQTTQSTNIKMIEITARNNNDEAQDKEKRKIVLRGFAFNTEEDSGAL